MQLKRVAITGYKSVKAPVTLYIGNNLTTIVGANDHGKSNLLEAIVLLNDGGTISETDVNWDLDVEVKPSIEWTFKLSPDEINKISEIVSEKHVEPPTNEEVKKDDNTEALAEGTITEPVEPKEFVCDVNKSGLLVLNLVGIGSNLKITSAPIAIGESLSPKILEMRPRVELIKSQGDQLPDSVTLEELNGTGQEFMKGIFIAAGLWDDKEKAFVYDAAKTTKRLDIASEKLTRYIQDTWKQGRDLAMKFDLQGDKMYLVIVDPAVKSLNPRPSTRSSGFKSFFYLTMVTNSRSHNDVGNKIFLFDEPGTYLHPQAQFDLQRGFERISRSDQIIYATHTPFLISKNYPERNRVVSKSSKGTLIDSKPFLGNWKSVSKSLGIVFGQYQNSPFSERVLMTEGPSDYYYILSAIRVLNAAGKVDIDINSLSCLDGKDSQAYVSMVKTLVEVEGKTVVCMFDGDEGGEDIKAGLGSLAKSLKSYKRGPHDQPIGNIIEFPLPSGRSTEDIFADESKFREATIEVAKEISMYSPSAKLKNELEIEKSAKDIKDGKGKKSLGKIMQEVTSTWTESGKPISKVNIALKYLELALPTEASREADETENENWHTAIKLPNISVTTLKDLASKLGLRGKAEVEEKAIETVSDE